MPIPLLYPIGVGLMTAGRFLLPRIIAAAPAIGRGVMGFLRGTATVGKAVVSNPVTNNPIKSALAVGIANKVTDGAVGDVALRVGEGAVTVASTVVGEDAVASAGKAALGAVAYAGEGLGKIGVSAAKRYGPDVLDSLPEIPIKGLGAITHSVKQGIEPAVKPVAKKAHDLVDDVRDVVNDGGISVDDTKRAGTAFREKANEVAESFEAITGGIVTSAEMKKFGDMVKREATTNKFIRVGLLLGGLNGAMKGDNWMTKGPRAMMSAIVFAAIFGAVGHYFFHERSELVETVGDKISSKVSSVFNRATDGVNSAPAERVAIPSLGIGAPRPSRNLAPAPSLM